MDQGERNEALQMAQQKMSESRQWWAAWDLAIHRYRCWALYFAAYSDELDEVSTFDPLWKPLNQGAYAAHDHMLVCVQDIWSCARSAVACEMAARIFYEEHEERETGRRGGCDGGAC